MLSKVIKVTHPSGLHARPAVKFVEVASSFPAEIRVSNLEKGGEPVNAKSILSVLTLGVSQGQNIKIEAEGKKALEALNALSELIENNFNEE